MRIIIDSLMVLANVVGQTNVGSAASLQYKILSPVYQGLIALAARLEAK
jgi:hypothetical protein